MDNLEKTTYVPYCALITQNYLSLLVLSHCLSIDSQTLALL